MIVRRYYYGWGLVFFVVSFVRHCIALSSPIGAISVSGDTTARTPNKTSLRAVNSNNDPAIGGVSSRRTFARAGGAFLALQPLLCPTLPAQAASKSASTASQEEADQAKLYKGYERLNYLLDNWQKETTVCGKGEDNPYLTGGGCERTPVKVMEFLGYKDIKDPLFKAERTMRRLEPLVPAEREIEFLEAVDRYVEASDEGSGMAYVSSWGEANPGGGKDRVELFIERAKKDVIISRDSLATIIEILQIAKPNN